MMDALVDSCVAEMNRLNIPKRYELSSFPWLLSATFKILYILIRYELL